jgi:hypothetical protein
MNNIHMEVIVGIIRDNDFEEWRGVLFGDGPIIEVYQYLIRCATTLEHMLGGDTRDLYRIGENYVYMVMSHRDSELTDDELRELAQNVIDVSDDQDDPMIYRTSPNAQFSSYEIRRVGLDRIQPGTGPGLSEFNVTTLEPGDDVEPFDFEGWALYGRTGDSMVHHIADTSLKEGAVNLYTRLTGNPVAWRANQCPITGLPPRIATESNNGVEIFQMLRDNGDFVAGAAPPLQTTRIGLHEQCIELYVAGHGVATMDNEQGTVAIVELYEGDMRIIVWADINHEDPTHTISLQGAREELRQTEGR